MNEKSNKKLTGNSFVDQLDFYQAANSDSKTIKANFVVRSAEFKLIIHDLKNKKRNDPLQHELILGRRGSGKSTLLKRIQVEIDEDPALSSKYIAINLAEEQAGIFRVLDLWTEVLKELSSKFALRLALKEFSAFKTTQEYTRYLYDELHKILEVQDKKAVLLLDNFDRIVESFNDEGNLLREILLNYNDIQIIAGSTRMNEHFWKYDKPFYEFFRVHRLEGLSSEEIHLLLNHWSNIMDMPELAEFTKQHPGKIEAIRILTDGLPRTLQFFIRILLQDSTLYGFDYIKRVMGDVTPLYQERLNYLPAAHRKIVLEMAFIWEACTVKQLVDKCSMESKLISAHLKQLSNNGIVEVLTTSKRNHLYRLSERFFNMWLIVTQGNPDQKRKAKWLTIFLEAWYDAKQLREMALEHSKSLQADELPYERAMILTKAYSQSKHIFTFERDMMLEYTLKLSGDKNIHPLLELPKKYGEIAKEISILYGTHDIPKALALADEIENEEDGVKFFIKGALLEADNREKEAKKFYLMAANKEHADASYNLANFYRIEKKNREAEKLYKIAIQKGVVDAFNNLAILYDEEGKHKEAEKYYMLAIKKGNVHALYNLSLYHYTNNIKKKETLDYIQKYINLKDNIRSKIFSIILNIWHGIFLNVYEKIIQLIQDSNYNGLGDFILHLLIHNQTKLVFDLFNDKVHGKTLQDKYSPLYYTTIILADKYEGHQQLLIPPEIDDTVKEIISEIKKKNVYYYFKE